MNLATKLLDRIKEQRNRIVVIGDTMIDRWVIGEVGWCQDGCVKFIQKEIVETPGGATNAERSISRWRVDTSLYGFSAGYCPVKCRYIDNSKIVFRADNDNIPSCSNYDWARSLALEMVQCAGGVLLSDYDKGFLPPLFIKEVAGVCKNRGIPCVADCKRSPDIYAGCILKGNVEWSFKYKPNMLTPLMIITNGRDSPMVEGRQVPINRSNIPCVNHVGAGDCFAAHLTLALAYGFSLKEAAALAHSAGRVYVQYPFNQPPLPSEVVKDLDLVRTT